MRSCTACEATASAWTRMRFARTAAPATCASSTVSAALAVTPFLIALTDAIYAGRRGAVWPLRLELAADLHQQFQREASEELRALDVVPVLLGSLAGVPVVQSDTPGAAVVLTDGSRAAVSLPA